MEVSQRVAMILFTGIIAGMLNASLGFPIWFAVVLGAVLAGLFSVAVSH